MQNEAPNSLPPYGVESVHNALSILLMFREKKRIRLVDASNRLKVSRSTAHRMLQTLAHDGFVEQDLETKAYLLGPAVRELALSTSPDTDILHAARPHMEELATQLNETVNLLISEGRNVRFIDGVESHRTVRVTSRVGLVRPAHVTSVGKLFLAEQTSQQLTAYVAAGLLQLTETTLTSEPALLKELEEIRVEGYAINRGEGDPSIHAIAAPVRDRSGRIVAGLAVSVPASRGGEERLRVFLEPLNQTVASIEADL